jgi:uncharacterized membrane protein YcjF (UPF0283 family)
MKRHQKLGWPGLGHSHKVLMRALRQADSELDAIRRIGVSKIKGGRKIVRELEARIADLEEGKRGLYSWAKQEIDA